MKRYNITFSSVPVLSPEQWIEQTLSNPYRHPFKKWLRVARYGGRQLKRGWTCEIEQDLLCMHGIDIGAKLERALAKEIEKEISSKYLHAKDSSRKVHRRQRNRS